MGPYGSGGASAIEGLLDRIIESPPSRRAEQIGSQDAAALLTELAEEAERWAIRDLNRALEATAILVELGGQLPDSRCEARARRAHAQALAYANRFDDALAELERSVRLAEAAGDAPGAARAKLAMVHALTRLGRSGDALAAGTAALASFRALDDAGWAAKAEANLGAVHRARNEPAEALGHFDRARAVLASDAVSLAQLDSNRAEALLELNRFAEAESAFAAALEAFHGAGLSRAAAIVEGNLADLMSRQGRLERAVYHFERARRRFEADRAAGDLARLEAEHAEALAGAGLIEQAVDSCAAAVRKLDEHGLAFEAARARAGLGRMLTSLRRFDDAEAVLAEAVAQLEALGSWASVARVQVLQGELALGQGRGWRAAGLLAGALELLGARPAEAAVARRHLAAMALAEGDIEEASEHIESALAAARAGGVTPLVADAFHLRSRVRAAKGDAEGQRRDLRAAVAAIERIRGSLQAERLRAAFAGSHTAPYEDLVSALLRSGRDDAVAAAFAVAEQAKGRALLDHVAGAVQSAAGAPAPAPGRGDDEGEDRIVAEVLRVRGELNALYSRLGEDDATENDDARERALRRQRAISRRERRLAELEGRLEATTGVGGLFAPTIDLRAAGSLLADDQVLVEYFVVAGEVLAFVVRRAAAPLVRELGNVDELAARVDAARFEIERPLGHPHAPQRLESRFDEDARQALRDLHELLVAPLADALHGAGRLVIVPHGPLHGVPFHALHDGARYLVEEYEITYSPSATLLRNLDPLPAPGGPARALLLGVADEKAPFIESEIRAVSGVLDEARVLIGAEATVERLQSEGREVNVIHLACHGRFSPSTPMSSGLRLSDRWLTIRDLYGLRLPGAVVVLSGCETGRAAIGGGDDLVGLARGFFAAGACGLMMSLWPVHDKTTGKLVAAVYDLWHNQRLRLPEAVRTAQRRMLQTAPHPAHWAPFVLVGRG